MHAFLEGIKVGGLVEVLQGDLEVIDDGQEVGEGLLATATDELALLLEGALAVVVILGDQTQVRVLELVELGLKLGFGRKFLGRALGQFFLLRLSLLICLTICLLFCGCLLVALQLLIFDFFAHIIYCYLLCISGLHHVEGRCRRYHCPPAGAMPFGSYLPPCKYDTNLLTGEWGEKESGDPAASGAAESPDSWCSGARCSLVG